MRLDLEALDHNIQTMAAWCAAHRVALCPHVKTTMSAPIVERQVAAGAVGVTVATVQQAAVVVGWGHRHVLIANEVVDRGALERLRALLEHDPQLRVRCFVDSAEGLAAAQHVFAGRPRPLEVLVDVGTPAGRTGVRHPAAARALAEAVHAAGSVRLVGVAGYEGVVPNTRDGSTLASVDDHCRRVRDVFLDVAELFETATPIYSMGGSAFPDRVVAHLPGGGAQVLLRSGCYVTHDHGTYAGVSPVPGLRPAVTVRAVVLSAPEPGRVVVGAGKRELPHDAGLPVLLGATGTVEALFDHHTVVTGAAGLAVGDVVELGISHPCSVFSRWRSYVTSGGEVWRTEF